MDIQIDFFHNYRVIGRIQAASLPYARWVGARWIQAVTPHRPRETRTAYPKGGTEYRLRSGYTTRAVTISVIA